jgi:hypothetical protein
MPPVISTFQILLISAHPKNIVYGFVLSAISIQQKNLKTKTWLTAYGLQLKAPSRNWLFLGGY